MNVKKVFKIKGMHCNSCAMLIEKEFGKEVNKIKASYADGKAEIDFDPSRISEKEIIKRIGKLGYEVIADKKENKESDNIGFYFMIGSILLFLVVAYFLFFNNISLPEIQVPQVGDNVGLVLLFLAGLLVGFHCVAMCGGFVVSYTAKNAINGHKSFTQHLVYGGSKVISYTIIGGIFGLIGGIFAFSIGLRGWVAILAGLFMIFYSLGMFGIGFFKKFQFNPKFLSKIANSESSKYNGAYSRPLATGLLNGLFIACGPLQAMYIYAAGTGSFISGATSLMAFGLGTLPIMLGFGSLTTVISHKTTKKILKISAIIVLILGLVMLNRGLTLTGSNYNYDSIKAQVFGVSNNAITSNSNNVVINNGIQEVNMEVSGSGYSPNSFVLKKGVPVKWNVNVKQLTGCNSELVSNEYNVNARLKQGLNTFEFTPDKTGTFGFSCGMGMIRGSFIVTDSGIASQQEVKAATPAKGSTCNMGSGGGGCGCGG
ncbi:MAG: sulfite exporter TauE/SafE family protein [Nanoarchaeota archaeon]|nr:sulfite exporter TauE/SafE family protein [Nanoarchaeota archaeon]